MTEMLMLAAREHLDAQMAGDADRLALTSAFPFMQVQSDGDASVYDSPEDLVDSVDGTFQTKLVDARLVESSDGGAVLRGVAQRSDLEGNPTLKVKAVWGLVQESDRWVVRWRHYLGPLG